jgi:uncharacterized membrane protein YccC
MKRLKPLFTRSILRMEQQEYAASLNGLNIVFGAILGVSLAGTEALEPLPFMVLLFMVAATVVAILYITVSSRRVAYAAILITVLATILLTRNPSDLLFGSIPLPDKLLPTLIVWTAATILVEFSPREKSPPPHQEELATGDSGAA